MRDEALQPQDPDKAKDSTPDDKPAGSGKRASAGERAAKKPTTGATKSEKPKKPVSIPKPALSRAPKHTVKPSNPEWSSAGLLVDASKGIRFELVPNDPDHVGPLRNPFATLSDAGRYSRVFLGRIVSAGGTTLRDVAVKVQRDFYTDEDSGITNPYVCELWEREYSSLSTFYDEHSDRGSRHGVVELLDLFTRPDPNAAPEQFPPVLFSRLHAAFFHPPCHTCGTLLRDCRDDTLLQRIDSAVSHATKTRVGLYHTSAQRFLGCPKCTKDVEKIEDVRLYTRNFPSGKTSKDYLGIVHDRNQLYADICEGVATGVLSASTLPFLEGNDDPFGDTPPKALFEPLSFHDFYALPLDCLHLQYHHAVQLVGGRTFQDYCREEEQDVQHTSAQAYLLEKVRPRLERSRQLIFESPDTEQHGLEVLKVKLNLFRDLCRGMASIHRHCGPHLDLKPENIMVKVPSGEGDVPTFWTLDTHVIDLASSRPFFHDSIHTDQLIFDRPINFTDTYTSPVIADQKNFKYRRQAHLELDKLLQNPDGTWVLYATLASQKIDASNYSTSDAITVNVPLDEGVDFLFRRIEENGANINRLSMQSTPREIDDITLEALKPLVDRRSVFKNVDYWTFKCFHVPCDLYSLGILLLQTLLETDKREGKAGSRTVLRGQSIVEIEKVARQLADSLERWARERITLEGSVTEADVRVQCKTYLKEAERQWRLKDEDGQRADIAPWCARENVFYDPSPEWWPSSRGIPEELFHDCLVVAMKLVTSIPGFSYCKDNSDFDLAAPEAKVKQVFTDIELLCHRVHASLFGYQATGRYVHAALDKLMDSTSTAPPVGLGGAVQDAAHSEARRLSKTIARLESNLQLTPDERGAQVLDQVKRSLDALEKPAPQQLFASYLRERFPFVEADIKHEYTRLERERDDLRGHLAALLGVSDVEDINPQRLEQISQVATLCRRLVEVIDEAPKTMSPSVMQAILEGRELPADQRDGRLRELLKNWALGEDDNIDLIADGNRILADKDVAKRLMFAYLNAVTSGVKKLQMMLPEVPAWGKHKPLLEAAKKFREMDPSQVDHKHFFPYFIDGFCDAPSQLIDDESPSAS